MNKPLFPDVVVNGETISSAAIAAEAQNHEAPRGKPGIAWRKAANALVVRALLLQESTRRSLTIDQQELAPGKVETMDEAAIRTLLEEAVSAAPPTEDAIRAEWNRDPSRFRAPTLWELSHILIACDPRDEAACKLAGDQITQLAKTDLSDHRSFARAARDNSDCPSRSQGGSLGQIGPGDTVPEFEAALAGLAEGDVTPAPVLTRHGWHLIRVDAIAEGAVLPFEAVRPKIGEALEKAAWTQGVRDFVNALVADATISGITVGQAKNKVE